MDYFSIFGLTKDEVQLIGFCDELKTILITKMDDTRIKYEVSLDNYNKVLHFLPSNCVFAGFQHTSEGYVFSTYINQ